MSASVCDDDLRMKVIAVARTMNGLGINQGTSGNVSARTSDGFLVTPTAMPYESMIPDDVVHLRLDGTPLAAGARLPTSEWRIHAGLYGSRPEVGGVVHTHGRFVTTVACLRHPLPAIHYLVGRFGGDEVPCAPYAAYGSPALAAHVVATMRDGSACLMANHGAVAVGADLDAALDGAALLEHLAEVYWRTLSVGGASLLSAPEMAEARVFLASYGQPR